MYVMYPTPRWFNLLSDGLAWKICLRLITLNSCVEPKLYKPDNSAGLI